MGSVLRCNVVVIGILKYGYGRKPKEAKVCVKL